MFKRFMKVIERWTEDANARNLIEAINEIRFEGQEGILESTAKQLSEILRGLREENTKVTLWREKSYDY
jgi:hypothetical protein